MEDYKSQKKKAARILRLRRKKTRLPPKHAPAWGRRRQVTKPILI